MPVAKVLFDKSEVISLEVEWAAGKKQTSTKLGTTKDGDAWLHWLWVTNRKVF